MLVSYFYRDSSVSLARSLLVGRYSFIRGVWLTVQNAIYLLWQKQSKRHFYGTSTLVSYLMPNPRSKSFSYLRSIGQVNFLMRVLYHFLLEPSCYSLKNLLCHIKQNTKTDIQWKLHTYTHILALISIYSYILINISSVCVFMDNDH